MSRIPAILLCAVTILYHCSNTAYACGWTPAFKPDVTDDVWRTLHERWKDIPVDWMQRVRGKDIGQIKRLLREYNLPADLAMVAKKFSDSDSAESFRESLKNERHVTGIRRTQAGYSRNPPDITRTQGGYGSLISSPSYAEHSLPGKPRSSEFNFRRSGRISRFPRT